MRTSLPVITPRPLWRSRSRSEEHTSELQSQSNLVCRLLLEKKKKKGFVISGTSPDGHLVEMIELRDHPWFLACQFHPEFLSTPNSPHPLFKGFIAACLAHTS